MGQLVNILYQITVALKVPVILGLMVALAWVLYEAGRFIRETVDRKRAEKRWRGLLALIPQKRDDPDGIKAAFFGLDRHPTLPAMLAEHAHDHQDNALQLDKIVSDVEIEASRRCHRMRIGVRVGPVLGLMGTLIPMGPALMSISTGNLAEMANNLIIAFSTTVVGLMIGAMCLVMLIARQHWYAKDMSDGNRRGTRQGGDDVLRLRGGAGVRRRGGPGQGPGAPQGSDVDYGHPLYRLWLYLRRGRRRRAV